MTAPVPNRHSPMAEVKKGVANAEAFTVDHNFLKNQSVKGMSDGSSSLARDVLLRMND